MYLADLASAFKPTYLPEDDPSDFSYFFDTSGRRTCYLAPERFYTADSEISRKKAGVDFGRSLGRVTEAMDVFGLGCVIAELFVEGSPPFTLSQLFKYRSGAYNLDPYLNQIEDANIRSIVKSMIALNPSERLSCEQYLSQAYEETFPTSFYDYFHDFVASLNDISNSGHPNWRTLKVVTASSTDSSSTLQRPQAPMGGADESVDQVSLPSNSDEIIATLWTDFATMEKHFSHRQKAANLEDDDPSQEVLKASNVRTQKHTSRVFS